MPLLISAALRFFTAKLNQGAELVTHWCKTLYIINALVPTDDSVRSSDLTSIEYRR